MVKLRAYAASFLAIAGCKIDPIEQCEKDPSCVVDCFGCSCMGGCCPTDFKCGEGFYCEDGFCLEECRTPEDCPAEQTCMDERCVPATPAECEGRIEASDYDGNCSEDRDCIAVYEGERADPCRCANAAISTLEYGAYTLDLGPRCEAVACNISCEIPLGGAASCVASTCELPQQ